MAEYIKLPIVAFETARLILRPIELADAPRIQLLIANPNVLKYLSDVVPWPYPAGGAREYLEQTMPKIEAMEVYIWAIMLKSQREVGLIGVISLSPGSDDDSRGFWLGEPYWGHGYMGEAAEAVTDFAFGPLGMKELLLGNATGNVASRRLKESAGAQLIGIEERGFVSGRFPCERWRLTPAAWRARRK